MGAISLTALFISIVMFAVSVFSSILVGIFWGRMTPIKRRRYKILTGYDTPDNLVNKIHRLRRNTDYHEPELNHQERYEKIQSLKKIYNENRHYHDFFEEYELPFSGEDKDLQEISNLIDDIIDDKIKEGKL